MPRSSLKKPPLSATQREEIEELYEKVRIASARLVGENGRTEALPNNIYSFLYRLLADLKAGKSIGLLQNEAPLTTHVASRMLGVSRQFLVNLLERGEIPFHKVGTHRRIYARDLLEYKAKRGAARRKALDDLARAEYDEGLYESN